MKSVLAGNSIVTDRKTRPQIIFPYLTCHLEGYSHFQQMRWYKDIEFLADYIIEEYESRMLAHFAGEENPVVAHGFRRILSWRMELHLKLIVNRCSGSEGIVVLRRGERYTS